MADIQATQAFVLAASNEPAETVQATQAFVNVAEEGGGDIEVTQGYVLAAVSGRVNDPSVRAWTFTLDGHDFYVLRLGNDETLVYDLHSQQWSLWGSGTGDIWSVYNGCNWVRGGDKFAQEYGSNILVGSDANGALYMLDPRLDQDDGAVLGSDNPFPFTRVVTTQLPVRGYDQFACYEVQLLGSIGDMEQPTLNSVTLSYSDDRGNSFTDAGTIEITDDDYDARVNWRSLGSFRSPGRLFRFEDTGALRRIDSVTVNSDMD